MKEQEIKIEDIVKQMFKINPLAQMIANSVGALVEQNAMNHIPTDKELEKLQSEMDQVQKNLAVFACEAKEKSVFYEQRMDEAGKDAERMTGELVMRTQERDQLTDLEREREVYLADRRGQLEGEGNLLEKNKAELSASCDRANKIDREYRKRKKQYWIPFYGWVLGIKDEVEDARGDVRRAENRCREQAGHCEEIERSCQELDAGIQELRGHIADIEKQVCEKELDIAAVTEKMKEFKEKMVYWEDKFIRTSKLLDKVQAGQTSPDVLMEILDLMDQMD